MEADDMVKDRSLERLTALPKISILIHNFNRASCLKNCLRSIAEQKYRPLEIIILDAGSSDDSGGVIADFISLMNELSVEVRFYSCAFMGVPQSRNLAAKYASGDILVFIDNDATLVGETSLEDIILAYQNIPGLSVVSFKVLVGDSDGLDPFSWIYRRRKNKWRDRQFSTFSFSGCAFCVTKKAFLMTGGFWESLTYSREEEEMALSLINLGMKIYYMPHLKVRHFLDPRGRMNLQRRRYEELKNGALIYWKRFPISISFLFISARLMTMSLRGLLREGIFPWRLFPAIKQASSERRDKNLKRDPVSFCTVWKYLRLHFGSE